MEEWGGLKGDDTLKKVMPSGAECACMAMTEGWVLARHQPSSCVPSSLKDGHAHTLPAPKPASDCSENSLQQ